MTLDDLAERAGLSASFMSLVERGRSSLALTSLFSVAHALGVDVGELLPTTEALHHGHNGCQVLREYAKEITPVRIGDRDYQFLAAEINNRVLEPLLVTVRPTLNDQGSYSHPGEEFAWVLSGEVVYVVEGREYPLRVGDCIHVDSTRSHGLRNNSGEDATVLWVLSQPLIQETLGELAGEHIKRVAVKKAKVVDKSAAPRASREEQGRRSADEAK
jgi:transcriptional regulator with XRE-family HTH domain